jgi:hypothetical protein
LNPDRIAPTLPRHIDANQERRQTVMQDAYFFGYGSLVNRATHGFTDARLAHLSGWRRVWRHTDLRPVAFLTVVPDEASEIEGLMAPVPDADWAALDEREAAYLRARVAGQVSHDLPHAPEIAVYTIPEGRHGAPDAARPVLLSYLDVVVQGYLREFGEAGVARFSTRPTAGTRRSSMTGMRRAIRATSRSAMPNGR